jgi:selenocysteine lyase/cysteine desulfurase
MDSHHTTWSKKIPYRYITLPLSLLYNQIIGPMNGNYGEFLVAATAAVSYNVEALRKEQFPLTQNTVYLNHAAISPLPKRTFDAIQQSNEYLLMDPAGSFEQFFMPRMTAFGEAVRDLINAQNASEIVGISSTSVGLNLVAQALPWKSGDNIVLCDGEFPSNVYPWMRLQEQYGVEIRFIRNQPGLTLDSLTPLVDSNTRLVTVSMVQFFSGHRTDLTAIGAFCREKNILFVVDAIQAICHFPVDVQAMNIDILATGGQKSLMGPPGQGFLYVREALANQMKPTFVSGNSVDDFFHWLKYDLTPAPGAGRFAMGTGSIADLVGLLESITFLRELGIASIGVQTTSLADTLIERLREMGYVVITPADHGPIVTFRAETEDATVALMEKLKAQRIFVAKHWDAYDVSHLRVSFHCYNNLTDIDRLLSVLKENPQ